MKKIFPVLFSLVLLGIAGYFWLYQEPSDTQPPLMEKDTGVPAITKEADELAPDTSASQQDTVVQFESLAVMDEEEKKIELLKVKDELDVLMARYDRYLSDESKRTEIKKEMQVLMDRYDKLVLQQAMSDIKKSKG